MPISLWFICGFYKWQHNQNIFITLLTLPEPQMLLVIFSSSSLFLFSSLILSHSKLVLYSSQLIFIMFSLSSSLSLSLSLSFALSLLFALFLMIYPFPAFQTLLLLLQMSAYVVNQPIKALCEILKITASKLIAAAVETLWQTIVRLANENISDRDLLEIFANQFQCLIAQALDIIRHTPDQRNIFLILIDEANLAENQDPIIKHLKHIQSQSDKVVSKGNADAILKLQLTVERLTQQILQLPSNRPGSRPLDSSTKQIVCFKFVTGKCPNAVCPGGFLHAYPEGTSDIEKSQHLEKAKLFIAGTLYPKKKIQKSS